MKVEIKLKDPKFCNGCPMLQYNERMASCHECCLNKSWRIDCDGLGQYIRHPQCVRDNGE